MNEVVHTRVSREELYEMVWSTPVTILSQKYGISDVGFAKVCRKLEVPLPPRGSREKMRWGHEVKKPRLPRPGKYTIQFHEFGRKGSQKEESRSQKEESKLGEDADKIIDCIRVEAGTIYVPEQLKSADGKAREVREALLKETPDKYGTVRPYKSEYFRNIRVSPGSIERSVLIWNAIISSAQKFGGKLVPYEYLSFLGEKVRFLIGEEVNSTRRAREPYKTTGKLTLRIDVSVYQSGIRKSMHDQPGKRIEEVIPDFLIAVVKAAAALRIERREKVERERLEEIRRQELREIEARKAQEGQKVQLLEEQATKWYKACHLKEFINHLEERASARHPLEIPTELANWLEWAKEYAHKIDPTHEFLKTFEKK